MTLRRRLLFAVFSAALVAAPCSLTLAAGTNEPAPGANALTAAINSATSATSNIPASQMEEAADKQEEATSANSAKPADDPYGSSLSASALEYAKNGPTNSQYAVDAPNDYDENGNLPPPPTLAQLENIKKEFPLDIKPLSNGVKSALPYDIRAEALREAALSYGARGGLAWRTYQIRAELEHRASYMDKVFDFRQLLIPAPSGLLIEPPVVSEQEKAMLIDNTGQAAAVADRIYNISIQAKIVGAPRHWRNYLERDWSKVDPPPDILRPNDDKERKKWMVWVDKGWQLGLDQADVMFQDDLAELSTDFEGMIRYRILLAQGIITPPYTVQTDRGVTGGGNKMRVGDRAVVITGMPALMPGAEKWQPASQ